MTLTPQMITIDTTDAVRLGRWWTARTGGTVEAENDGWFVVVALPAGPRLAFQRVEDPTPGKNRVHVDFAAADLAAEVAALVSAGASKVAEHEMAGHRWVTLADPEGNQFCVAQG